MSTNHSPEIYDAIVVGSGATGGVAAKTLSERGMNVLVLEAGPKTNPQTHFGSQVQNLAKRFYNLLVSRRQSFQSTHPGYWKADPDLFIDEKDNPYTTPEDKPFYWMRGRQVGGKSLTWGGITLRLSDYEFKAASRDGYGEDWPIAYADLAPYYDELERFFQVEGHCDGLPQLPDGQYLSPAAFTPAELHLKELVEHQDELPFIISRGFPLHKPTKAEPWSRSASPGSSLKVALETGNVTLQSDAVVRHILFDPQTRKARGVSYVDRVKKTSHEVLGKIVVLCASTLESVRILLHSTDQYQPGGLRNESGMLGHFLMDHISTTTFFFLPNFPKSQQSFPLSGSESIFIPRFCNLEGQEEQFLRGYGIWGGVQRVEVPKIVKKVGEGAIGFFVAHGEVLPRYENHVQLNSNVVDAWGIPVPHIDCTWSENEHKMASHMNHQIEEIVKRGGGQCMKITDMFHIPLFANYVRRNEEAMAFAAPPGYYIHEVGGARMGTSPENSVVNEQNQCWEAPNLLVTDGACWVSSGWQSPTLTEMAITARACTLIDKGGDRVWSQK